MKYEAATCFNSFNINLLYLYYIYYLKKYILL
jgi:hypothetical protein